MLFFKYVLALLPTVIAVLFSMYLGYLYGYWASLPAILIGLAGGHLSAMVAERYNILGLRRI